MVVHQRDRAFPHFLRAVVPHCCDNVGFACGNCTNAVDKSIGFISRMRGYGKPRGFLASAYRSATRAAQMCGRNSALISTVSITFMFIYKTALLVS